tara:strand:+ start:4630 stop:5346 length:717 start_codon:yes stop_codon:yes gene_type:complete
MEKIIIVIPTYKEEKNIVKLTNKLTKILPNSLIYVIDDTKNSKIGKVLSKNKNIKYFLRKNKKGRGSAVLYGLKKSLNKKASIFIEMDADFSHRPNEIKKNLHIFKKKKLDLLVSSRYLPQSKIYNWSISRRIFSILANFLAKILLNVNVSDYTNGFRIYSRKSVNLIVKNCGNIGDGFIVLSEILLTIYSNGLKISEVPSIFINRKRGESSVNFLLIIQSLIGIMKLYLIKNKILFK